MKALTYARPCHAPADFETLRETGMVATITRRAASTRRSHLGRCRPRRAGSGGRSSLMPMLNCRLLKPDVFVNIDTYYEALNRLDVTTDSLTVGALVRHADLLHDDKVCAGWPLLFEATKQVAHPAIRNRGTVCGSVAHNDPAAEHPSVLVTLDGTVVIAGAAGRRELAAEQFFTGILSTALAPGEMVVAAPLSAAAGGRRRRICGICPPPSAISPWLEPPPR